MVFFSTCFKSQFCIIFHEISSKLIILLSRFILHATTLLMQGQESTMYFIGRVTLFFANKYLTEYRITMEF